MRARKRSLAKFPRPAHDNGIGLHFTPDLVENNNRHSVSWGIERLKYVGATYTTIYGNNDPLPGGGVYAARRCWEAGILPISRPMAFIDRFYPFAAHTEALLKANVPAYVQLYNEPGDPREWRDEMPHDADQRFAEAWARAAEEVVRAGGMPGLQTLSRWDIEHPAEVVSSVLRGLDRSQREAYLRYRHLKYRGVRGSRAAEVEQRRDLLRLMVNTPGQAASLWDMAFFSLHNYGASHPPAYPYDELNQRDHPGATLDDDGPLNDDTTVLNGLEYGRWLEEILGMPLPMFGTEGGWLYGDDSDRRYVKCEGPVHADYTVEHLMQYKTGRCADGRPLPPWWVNTGLWIVGGYDLTNWYGGAGTVGPWGDGILASEAVHAMSNFERWTEPQTLEASVRSAAVGQTLLEVETESVLSQAARNQLRGYAQTREFGVSYEGRSYTCQMFNYGIGVLPAGGDVPDVTFVEKEPAP